MTSLERYKVYNSSSSSGLLDREAYKKIAHQGRGMSKNKKVSASSNSGLVVNLSVKVPVVYNQPSSH